jgi:hypothetical protein
MVDEEKLRHRMQRIADLVQRLDSAQDAGLKAQAKELMESVMDLHGEAMERVLAAIRDSGDSARRILAALSVDPVVSSVLLLYGLHPLDFDARVRAAAEKITDRLRSQGARVEGIAVDEGAIRILVRGVDHAFTARSVKSLIEEEIYAAAPDAASLVIDGLEKFAPADFVPLEKVGVLTAGKAGD